MTIDKAIEIIEYWIQDVGTDETGELFSEALQLSLEALKHIKESRPTGIHEGTHILPRETAR